METSSDKGKRKWPKWLKVAIWVMAPLMVITGSLFAYGYFRYGKIIRTFLIEAVERESKGLYRAEVGGIFLNVLDGNLTVRDMELIPDTALYRQRAETDTLSPMLFRLKIDRFRITGFEILKAARERKIIISDIRFIRPEITMFRMRPSVKAREDHPSHRLMSVPLPAGWNLISIREIAFENGKVDFYDFAGDSVIHQAIPSCNILISNLLVDSVHTGKRRLFNADDITITINDLSVLMKNGLNRITLGQVGLSTGKNTLYVSDFHLVPQYNRHDYTRKVGFQTDRMDVFVKKISLERLNFRDLALAGEFQAGLLTIDSLVLEDYRDKRIPRKPGFRPPMPQDGLRKLKMYLKIDTVLLSNGKATYLEQVNEEPGTIFFDKMTATLTGLTNDSLLLHSGLISELKGTAYMMGKGRLDATIQFKFGDPKNTFTFSASLGPMDLREINPMLTKLIPGEVKSGRIKQLSIPFVSANDDVAKGKLLFYYNDLNIAMTTSEKSTWNSIKKGVINFVANDIVVNNDNPSKSGKMKTGVILFHRDKEKGIINYLWKSAFSGLKSTVGINTKEQKEVKKQEKAKKNVN